MLDPEGFDIELLFSDEFCVRPLILCKTDLSIVHKAEDIFQILTLNPSDMTGTSSRSRFSPEQMFEKRHINDFYASIVNTKQIGKIIHRIINNMNKNNDFQC